MQSTWVQETESVISAATTGMAETLIFYIVSASQLLHCRIRRIRCKELAYVCLATEEDGRERGREGFGIDY